MKKVFFLSKSECPIKHIVTEQKVEWGHTLGSTIAITAHFFCAAIARHPLSKTGNILLSSKVQTSAGLAAKMKFYCYVFIVSALLTNVSTVKHNTVCQGTEFADTLSLAWPSQKNFNL